jgi:hypothetical protein
LPHQVAAEGAAEPLEERGHGRVNRDDAHVAGGLARGEGHQARGPEAAQQHSGEVGAAREGGLQGSAEWGMVKVSDGARARRWSLVALTWPRRNSFGSSPLWGRASSSSRTRGSQGMASKGPCSMSRPLSRRHCEYSSKTTAATGAKAWSRDLSPLAAAARTRPRQPERAEGKARPRATRTGLGQEA